MVLGTQVLAHAYYVWWIAQLVAVALLVFLALRWHPKFLQGKSVSQSLGATLDARAARIQEQLDAAERSRQEAARIQAEARREIEQARSQATEIVGRAEQTSMSIQREIEERAEQEYRRIRGQAREEIDYERRQAELALRRRAADIVVDAAGQIIEQNLTPESDRRIIGQSLADLREVS